jgi:hypothetical protein
MGERVAEVPAGAIMRLSWWIFNSFVVLYIIFMLPPLHFTLSSFTFSPGFPILVPSRMQSGDLPYVSCPDCIRFRHGKSEAY